MKGCEGARGHDDATTQKSKHESLKLWTLKIKRENSTVNPLLFSVHISISSHSCISSQNYNWFPSWTCFVCVMLHNPVNCLFPCMHFIYLYWQCSSSCVLPNSNNPHMFTILLSNELLGVFVVKNSRILISCVNLGCR